MAGREAKRRHLEQLAPVEVYTKLWRTTVKVPLCGGALLLVMGSGSFQAPEEHTTVITKAKWRPMLAM